jgi:geranylgeranyl diphosphate synthase type I
MLMLPTLCIDHLNLTGEVKWLLSRCIAAHGAQTAHGQASEMQLRQDTVIDRSAFMLAARGKTGGLFGMPVEGAALLMGRSPEQARQAAHAFELLGLLFQLQDDVIDLFGNKGRASPGGDIREGKVSALVVAHVEQCPDDRLWLHSILRMPRERVDAAVVDEVAKRFVRSGALDVVLEEIEDLEAQIRDVLCDAIPDLEIVADALLQRVTGPLSELRVPGVDQ